MIYRFVDWMNNKPSSRHCFQNLLNWKNIRCLDGIFRDLAHYFRNFDFRIFCKFLGFHSFWQHKILFFRFIVIESYTITLILCSYLIFFRIPLGLSLARETSSIGTSDSSSSGESGSLVPDIAEPDMPSSMSSS